MARLIGLDFETANPASGSICAAGCAIMEDGAVVESREWLIRPHRALDRMSRECFAIHGIGWYDLREAPEFPAVWPVLRRMLTDGGVAIMHNAPFDLAHLAAVLERYRLPAVSFEYVCSLELSRERLPGIGHALDAMAAHFGHKFRHHDALEDAIACATVAQRLGRLENSVRRFDYCPSRI